MSAYKTKQKKRIKFPEFNTTNECTLSLKNGVASIESDTYIVGLEVWFSGKFNIESLMQENWIVEKGNKKLIVVDTSFVGIKNGELFKIHGLMKITKLKAVDTNIQLIEKANYGDRAKSIWSFLSDTDYAVTTTNWEDYKTENQRTQYKQVANDGNIIEPAKELGEDWTTETTEHYIGDSLPKELGGG